MNYDNSGWSLLGSGISTAQSYANSVTRYKNARKLALLNAQIAETAATKQYERALSAWRLQNAYNSPSAQRDRLLAAGMSPALMMGSGATAGNAGMLPSVPGNAVELGGVFPSNMPLPELSGSEMASIFTQVAQANELNARASLTRREEGMIPYRQALSNSEIYLNETKALSNNASAALSNANRILTESTTPYELVSRGLQLENAKASIAVVWQEYESLVNHNRLFPLQQQELKNTLKLQLSQLLTQSYERTLTAHKVDLTDAQKKVAESLAEFYAEKTLSEPVNRFLTRTQIGLNYAIGSNVKATTELTKSQTTHVEKTNKSYTADRINEYIKTGTGVIDTVLGFGLKGALRNGLKSSNPYLGKDGSPSRHYTSYDSNPNYDF